jgi:hypothetical protein
MQPWRKSVVANKDPTTQPAPATLKWAYGPDLTINSEAELRQALDGLRHVTSGKKVSLRRGSRDYIEATRKGEFWSVATRRGFWLTPFSADLSSEYSERTTRQMRAHRSMREFLIWLFRSPHPEAAISTSQVATLFTEYFTGKSFSLMS